jgi:hypothetical protein
MTLSPYWLFNEYVSTVEPIKLKWQIIFGNIFGNISRNGPFLGTILDLEGTLEVITLPLEFGS